MNTILTFILTEIFGQNDHLFINVFKKYIFNDHGCSNMLRQTGKQQILRICTASYKTVNNEWDVCKKL